MTRARINVDFILSYALNIIVLDRGYGYDQYYDRFYDRPGYRAVGGGYYDNRYFRPNDETYR